MKVQEFIDLFNKEKEKEPFYSLYDAEDFIPSDCPRVASGLNIDKHRWYENSTSVYQLEDGYIGVTGPSDLFSESMSYSDCCAVVKVEEYEEYTITSYKRKV